VFGYGLSRRVRRLRRVGLGEQEESVAADFRKVARGDVGLRQVARGWQQA
jgi:hypothetical protein